MAAREGGTKSGKKKRSKRNKAKHNQDEKHEAPAPEASSGVDDNQPSDPPHGDTSEPPEDKRKDDLTGADASSENPSLEAESKQIIEIPVIEEETGTVCCMEESAALIEAKGEWEQREHAQSSGGDTNRRAKRDEHFSCNGVNGVEESSISNNSEIKENQAAAEAQVEEKEADFEAGALHYARSNGLIAEAATPQILEQDTASCAHGAHEASTAHPLRKDATTADTTHGEYRPSAGVIDGQRVVAAEMYLVTRLQALIGLQGPGATPGAAGVPVVWM